MDALTPALAGLAAGGQQPIHGADRTMIAALIEQRGIDRGRRHVGEALAVEDAQQQILLANRERQRGRARDGCRSAVTLCRLRLR
jgi:hypothetical protein